MTNYIQSEVVDLLNLDKKNYQSMINYRANFVHKIKIIMNYLVSLKELVRF